MSKDLDVEVKALLLEQKGDWKRIADLTNVSYSWISKFMNGHIPKPGYATLRDLKKALKDSRRIAA